VVAVAARADDHGLCSAPRPATAHKKFFDIREPCATQRLLTRVGPIVECGRRCKDELALLLVMVLTMVLSSKQIGRGFGQTNRSHQLTAFS